MLSILHQLAKDGFVAKQALVAAIMDRRCHCSLSGLCNFDLIGNLAHHDLFGLQPFAAQQSAGAVDHFGAGKGGALCQDGACKQIASFFTLIAQDAIVEQVDGDAATDAQQR